MNTIFEAYVQELLNMPINLLIVLYLVYPRYLFNMGPAYLFSRGVETLLIDRYLTLELDTWGPEGVSLTDEVWGNPIGEKGPLECGDLLLQLCCRTEDTIGGVSLDE